MTDQAIARYRWQDSSLNLSLGTLSLSVWDTFMFCVPWLLKAYADRTHAQHWVNKIGQLFVCCEGPGFG